MHPLKLRHEEIRALSATPESGKHVDFDIPGDRGANGSRLGRWTPASDKTLRPGAFSPGPTGPSPSPPPKDYPPVTSPGAAAGPKAKSPPPRRAAHTRNLSSLGAFTNLSPDTSRRYHGGGGGGSGGGGEGEDGFVKWGVHLWLLWRVPVAFALAAGAAVGHHLLYASLDGKWVPVSLAAQQWYLRAGMLLSIVAYGFLRIVLGVAYVQYAWFLLRRHAVTLGGIDALFALLVDPIGVFRFELLRIGPLAVLAAIISWCLPLVALSPTASLSIVEGPIDGFYTMDVPTFYWNNSIWTVDATPATSFLGLTNFTSVVNPSPAVLKVATQTAYSNSVPIVMAPAGQNSSFRLQFFGPSVQCDVPNTAQQAAFISFAAAYANETYTSIANPEQIKSISTNLSSVSWEASSYLLWSAFNPTAEVVRKWSNLSLTGPDANNNWNAALGPTEVFDYANYTQQLWVQTSASNLVCALVNASFDVSFSYLEGVGGAVTSQTVEFQNSWIDPLATAADAASDDGILSAEDGAYLSAFLALTNLLNGNVSLVASNMTGRDATGYAYLIYNSALQQQSSRVLDTGLVGCEEFTASAWISGSDAFHVNELSAQLFPVAATAASSTCRNQTVGQAIQDLMNNITIGLLASDMLTNPTGAQVAVTTTSFGPAYAYSVRNLVISYLAGACATLAVTLLGAYAMARNGVVHDGSFGAALATTRNPALDELVVRRAQSLGAAPRDPALARVRLTFGSLRDDSGQGLPRHVAFGFPHGVTYLRKGDPCC